MNKEMFEEIDRNIRFFEEASSEKENKVDVTFSKEIENKTHETSKHEAYVEQMYSQSIEKHKQSVLRGKTSLGKRLTQPMPFELQTSKRQKVEQTEKENYVPLWQQVKDSFQLRPDDMAKDVTNLESMLNPSRPCSKRMTMPMSPKFATKERSEIKGKMDEYLESNEETSQFKAQNLNKKILSQVDRLPDVEKKELTSFQEFNLSKLPQKIEMSEERIT